MGMHQNVSGISGVVGDGLNIHSCRLDLTCLQRETFERLQVTVVLPLTDLPRSGASCVYVLAVGILIHFPVPIFRVVAIIEDGLK
jgi:hypothetical protein